MASRLFYGVLLALVLAVLWLLLSGYWFKPLLVGFGVFAVIVALVATARMGLLDGESVPFARLPQYLKYWGWLGAEIFKANIAVVRIAMAPDLNIKPVMTRVAVTAKSDMARTTYANSITLTPGTLSLKVDDDHILVHAAHVSGLDDLDEGEMDRRVTRLEGSA